MQRDYEGPVDLSIVYWQRNIAELVASELDRAVIEANQESFRSHLGASVIGNPCSRYIYYHWHWCKSEEFDGRTNRLFEYGHILETRIRKAMRARGAEFLDTVDVDGKQLKVSALGGHYGGSVDGVFKWPSVGIYDPMLLECKSSQTGSPFNDLGKKGVLAAKPQHYSQNSVYGKYLNIPFVCYVAENKNDSDIHVEIVELDFRLAEELERKAYDIITNPAIPPKLSNKPEYYLCKMCSMHSICQMGELIKPNCRNCANCSAIDNASFNCSHWNATIPKEHLINGCSSYRPLVQIGT